MAKKPTPPAERFFRYVQKSIDPAGCWLWVGVVSWNGYGRFWPGVGRRQDGAHRFAWEHANGPIPKGLCVLHRCDVRNCVNPSHLFLGTKKQNTEDMIAKGRAGMIGEAHWSRRHPERIRSGAAHGRSKLTETQAREIVSRRLTGQTRKHVAAEFGVTPGTIAMIWSRRTWRHLECPIDKPTDRVDRG